MILEHFIVEDREVECEAELDWVARGKVNLVGFLVGLFSLHLHVL